MLGLHQRSPSSWHLPCPALPWLCPSLPFTSPSKQQGLTVVVIRKARGGREPQGPRAAILVSSLSSRRLQNCETGQVLGETRPLAIRENILTCALAAGYDYMLAASSERTGRNVTSVYAVLEGTSSLALAAR